MITVLLWYLLSVFFFGIFTAPEKKFDVYQKKVNNDTVRVVCMVSGVYPVPRLTLYNNSVTDKQWVVFEYLTNFFFFFFVNRLLYIVYYNIVDGYAFDVSGVPRNLQRKGQPLLFLFFFFSYKFVHFFGYSEVLQIHVPRHIYLYCTTFIPLKMY